MKVLIADDDTASRVMLEAFVTKWGYEPVSYSDGSSAMMALRSKDAPLVAILDWMMPGLDGIEICRRLREVQKTTYVLLLTSRDDSASLVQGLEAGANDYITKPFKKEELRVRLQVGVRYAEMQALLNQRLQELESALAENRVLKNKYMY